MQCERRGILEVSADGRTLKSLARRRVVAIASRGASGLGMIDGSSFEVTITALTAPADDKIPARLVGLAPRGAFDSRTASHVVPTTGVHLSSDGYLWVNGYRRKSAPDNEGNKHTKFGKGDTIRCQLVCGCARFYKNGQPLFETEGVAAGVFPTITLAGYGDKITIDTPVLSLPGEIRACVGDPLACLFETQSLLKERPDPALVTAEYGRATSTSNLEPFLLEKHLFAGLSAESMQDVARKIVEAIRGRLTVAGKHHSNPSNPSNPQQSPLQHDFRGCLLQMLVFPGDRKDPIHATADARAARFSEMAPHLLKRPDAEFVLYRSSQRPGGSGSESTSKAAMYGATLSGLIIATREVVMVGSSGVIASILDALLAGVRAVDANGLAIDNPERPGYITEADLNGLAELLGELMGRENGVAAVAVALTLARKRRRFRDVLALCSSLRGSQEDWAAPELEKVELEMIEATESWDVTAIAPPALALEHAGAAGVEVLAAWTRKVQDTSCSMIDAYSSVVASAEPSMVQDYFADKTTDAGEWGFLEAPQGGILEVDKEQVSLKPRPKPGEEPTYAQLWQLDSTGRLLNATGTLKKSVLNAFQTDSNWDQPARVQESNAIRSKDTVRFFTRFLRVFVLN